MASLLPRRAPQLLPLLQHLSLRPTPTVLRLRPQFQQQLLRHASKKVVPSVPKAATKKKTSGPPQKKPTVVSTPATPKYFSLSEQLGSSGKKSILLYASDPRLFVFSCYGLAVGMVSWCVYTFRTNIANSRPGLPNWVVKVTYVSVSIMMLLAVGVAYYPTRLVQMIYAHPVPATARAPAAVRIVLHRRPLLPTLPFKRIEVERPELITLGEPLQGMGVLKEKKEVEVEDRRSLGVKVRHGITRAPGKMFEFFRSALSTGGFVLLRVDGVGKFRVSKDGWVWEKRGLDMLFRQERL